MKLKVGKKSHSVISSFPRFLFFIFRLSYFTKYGVEIFSNETFLTYHDSLLDSHFGRTLMGKLVVRKWEENHYISTCHL
jgi:hypothetical protein